MGAPAMLVALGAIVMVLAQSDHAIQSFAYQGCSSVDMSCFTPPVYLNGGPITPEMCQQACQGHQFAALFPSDCRCGDDASVIKSLDERACNYPCLGDPKHGMCGSICPDEGPGIGNVYTKTQTASQQPPVETWHATTTLALPVTSTGSKDCLTSDQDSVTEKPDGGMITPAGPAPEVPTTFTFVLTSPSLTTVPVSSAILPGSAGPTTSCTEEESSLTEEPTMVPPSTTCEEVQDHGSITPSSDVPASSGPTTASPPVYSSAPQRASSPTSSLQSYPDSSTTEQDQDPAATASSVPDSSQEVPNYSSTSTLWSRPSDTVDPTGQPPVPAQVPGSDSTHSMVPPLATIGGLALIAAIIM